MSSVPSPRLPRRRWKKWIAVVIACVSLLLIIAVCATVLLLHNYALRQRIIQFAQTRIENATGVTLQVRDFGLHLSGIDPSVDMYDVTVDSAAPFTGTPVLKVDHLSAGVRVISIFHRAWYLSNVRIDHPVVRIFVDTRGNNNLPRLKQTSSNSGTRTDLFDLGVRHVVLTGGEIYYNDRTSSLDADVHDLSFQSVFSVLSQQYSADLSYHNGNITLAGYNPLIHSLDAQFDAARSGLTVKKAVIGSGSSQVVLSGTLQNYAQPNVQARYDGTLNSGELGQLAKLDTLPAGIVRVSGSGRYVYAPNRPVLETLNIEGNISSGQLHVAVPKVRTDIRDFSARYQLQNGNVEVSEIRAGILGGNVAGTFTMDDIENQRRAKAQFDAHGIDLAALRTLAGSPGSSQVRVRGSIDAKLAGAWNKTLDTLVAQTDATVRATAAPTQAQTILTNGSVAAAVVPLTGSIHARYQARGETISFTPSELSTPQTTLTLNGTVSKTSALQVRFDSRNLHEIETIGDEFGLIPSTQPIGLSGTATFTGTVSGSVTEPRIAGELTANAFSVRQTSWQMLHTRIEASPSSITLADGALRPAQRGNLTFNVGADLNHWTFDKTNPIRVDLTASQLDLEELARLMGFKTPVSGTLAVNVALRGSAVSPTGQGTLDLTQASLSGEPVQAVNVSFHGTPDDVQGQVHLKMAAGNAQANIRYMPKEQHYEGQLTANGIQLEKLETVAARNAQIGGVLNITASGSGTIQDPELQLKAQIPQLTVRDQKVNGVTVQAAIAKHVAMVSLDSQMLNTALKGNGTINLTGDYYTDAKIDTMPIALEPLIAIYAPSQAGSLTGTTEVHATLRGPLKQPAALDAHITIPTLSLNYKDTVKVAATEPIQADYTKGVLTVQKTAIRGTGTDLQIEGTIPTTGSAPISLLLVGTLDLNLLQLVDSDLTSSGQIRFNINSMGRTDPNVQGQIQVVNANVTVATAPIGLQNGNGTLRLTNDRLEVQSLRGTVGGGNINITGNVIYKPQLAFNIVTAGSGIRLLFPENVREAVSTNLTLTGNMDSAQLRGRVQLDQVSFTKDFDLADILGQFSGSSSPPTTGFARNLQLSIAVQSSTDVNLVSSQLSLQGAANLRVQGTAAEPSILGRISLDSGDLIFMGNRYVLQPSTIEFSNPSQIQPVVNLEVDTKVKDYDVHMHFRGPVNRLTTNYTSDPALAESDIINLLVFGQTTEASAANPTPGNLGAESAIASQVSGQVTNRVQRAVGLSQLSVDPVLGCNQQNAGACVTVQQRVTSNLFVTFATDVTSTQGEVIKMEYQATPRVSFSLKRDDNGGVAVDMRIHKIW